MEYGPLNRYRGPEPWFTEWTPAMLDLRAASTLKKGIEKKKRSKIIEEEDVTPPNRRKTTVKRKKLDEGEKQEKEEIERESEFDNQNEADDDQEEKVQNKSPMTSSQAERELDNIWPTMVFDEEVILKNDEDVCQYFASKK
ncbi:hypothetical protein PIB30_060180 [Stylosanthes scabra]|uniref:Uncharacterized protein n=1 Tax=Stylosanthes scabra TaxID=79078 RepID=A0ABU6SLB8_9FABA|nr:hypothetical protein [Stylosanthes scabra]